MDLLPALRDFFRRHAESSCWIVGFSGGLDSRVLLDLVLRYRAEANLPTTLLGAHLHHGLRDADADADLDFCQTVCQEAGIECITERADVASLARRRQAGLEEAGRFARHVFFGRLAREHAPAKILLAHHADDQLETVLMQIQRNVSPGGLGGMAVVTDFSSADAGRFTILRPLLPVWREQILTYARERGLAWREDASNIDTRFLRNRIRHEIVPELRRTLPDLPKRMIDAAQRTQVWQLGLLHLARGLLQTAVRPVQNGQLLNLDETLTADRQVLEAGLRLLLRERLDLASPSRHDLMALQNLIDSGRTGAVAQLASGVRARRETDGLFLFRADDEPLPPEGELLLPTPPFRIEAQGVSLRAALRPPPLALPEQDRDDPQVAWVDADALKRPLVLRAWRDGDRIAPLGAPGTRKVQDVLVDRKIPQREKAQIRILADYAGPVWVWPCCIANRVRIRPETKNALRLEMRPAEE